MNSKNRDQSHTLLLDLRSRPRELKLKWVDKQNSLLIMTQKRGREKREGMCHGHYFFYQTERHDF